MLNPDRQIGREESRALESVAEQGIVRVVATGRSLYSARLALDDAAPIDYLVYSSGIGAVRWPGPGTLFANEMPAADTLQVRAVLNNLGCDYMAQRGAPETHCFDWTRNSRRANPDFDARIERYAAFARPWSGDSQTVSHFVIVHPATGAARKLAEIRARLASVPVHVVRTTSPLDGESLWVEIFPAGVSKASGCQQIASRHGVLAQDVLAVGNDFNDLDLLRWAGHARVVGNAPDELAAEFSVVASNAAGGVAQAIAEWL